MSVRRVAFGAAGRAFNGCREGQFDECGVVVGGHHFAKSSVDGRRCDSDGIAETGFAEMGKRTTNPHYRPKDLN